MYASPAERHTKQEPLADNVLCLRISQVGISTCHVIMKVVKVIVRVICQRHSS